MIDKDELCVMIPTSQVRRVFEPKRPLSFASAKEWDLPEILDDATWTPDDYRANLMPRSKADSPEMIGRYMHLITYIVVTEDAEPFIYRRGESGGEGRLHGLHSIGFGGHVTASDFEWFMRSTLINVESLHASAKRELHEELDITQEVDLKFVGSIGDESTPVNAVHLGLVFHAELRGGWDFIPPKAKEPCIGNLRLITRPHLKSFPASQLEPWSRILVEQAMRPDGSSFF